MKKPVVAVIGRPNVGKSTLANRLLGSRQAIVDSVPGVTRDRLYFEIEWSGYNFTLIDTGGIIPGVEDEFSVSINEQVKIATKQADVLLFLVDGTEGLTPTDEEIANLLRKVEKPILLVVNKIDTPEKEVLKSEFYQLGMGEPYTISAIQGSGGVGDLLDEIINLIPKIEDEEEEILIPRIAVVGRPNVGKSSIVNFLLGEKRVIVSEKSGTTRDTIDSVVKYEGKEYILTDTAGLRKRSKVEDGVERYSVIRALDAIRDSDVTVLVVDAKEGITDQDKKIAEFSNECGKGLVIVVNKWDLIDNKDSSTMNGFIKNIKEELPHANFSEIVFTSALTGQRLAKIYNLCNNAFDNSTKTIKTNLLNQVINESMAMNPPKSVGTKRLKVYYSTQVNTKPPAFIMFVNKEKLFENNYLRYIENKIRESFDFSGTPIKIIVKEKTERASQKISMKGKS